MSRNLPIIFSADSIRGILAGRKTQTRRVIKPQPKLKKGLDLAAINNVVEDYFWYWKDCKWLPGAPSMPESAIEEYAPYKVGDVLWIREGWIQAYDGSFAYRADRPEDTGINRSPMFMPREAARLFLRVTGVRAERVQGITEKDAEAEGIRSYWLSKEAGEGADDWHESNSPPFLGARGDAFITRREAFRSMWDDINAKRGYPWIHDPWVWVIEFEQIDKPEEDKHDRP